jgi:hypothetical protein
VPRCCVIGAGPRFDFVLVFGVPSDVLHSKIASLAIRQILDHPTQAL